MFPIRGKQWRDHEVVLLKRYFPVKPNKVVALFTGHSVKSVARKAVSLGLRKENTGIRWTADMEGILQANYPVTENRKLAEWLGVGVWSVVRKAKEMGLRKEGRLYRPERITCDGHRRDIGPEQDAYIRAHLDSKPMQVIARELGYSRSTISRYCARKGITPGKN